MASVGGEMMIENHGGTRLSVAEALLLGELSASELQQVEEVVSPLLLETARIRLQALGRLSPRYITEAAVPDGD